MVDIGNQLIEKMLVVLQGQKQASAHHAVEGLRALTNAFCNPDSSEPFPVLVVSCPDPQAVPEIARTR